MLIGVWSNRSASWSAAKRVRKARNATLGVQQQCMLGFKMAAEVHFPLEGPAAVGTGKRFEPRVLTAVRDEVGALAERLPALLALVGLLSCNRRKPGA